MDCSWVWPWACWLPDFYVNDNAMEKEKEDIPLFKTWNGWYLFVILFLVLLIFLFYGFTKYFA
jgi:hypothetical protein